MAPTIAAPFAPIKCRKPGDAEGDQADEAGCHGALGDDRLDLDLAGEHDHGCRYAHHDLDHHRGAQRHQDAHLVGEGRAQLLEHAEHHDHRDAQQEDHRAALRLRWKRPCFEHRQVERGDVTVGHSLLVLRVVLELLADTHLEEAGGYEADDAGWQDDYEDVGDAEAERIEETNHRGHRRADGLAVMANNAVLATAKGRSGRTLLARATA
jgi:hypothetical protein